MRKYERVLVTGASGIIGYACQDALRAQGYPVVLTPGHCELDLLNEASVKETLKRLHPDAVIHCAALAASADIMRNQAARILADNMTMTAILANACAGDVRKFVFLGSGSVYGPLAHSPFREEEAIQSIQGGDLEGYAISKIAGLCLCKQFARCSNTLFTAVLPTHVYGCYSIARKKDAVIDSLVLALLHAKREGAADITLDIWGTGRLCKRQYMHVADCARAIVHILETYDDPEPVNLAVDEPVCLDDVVQYVAARIEYTGRIHYLTERREVASNRLMCVDKLNGLGFVPQYDLQSGLDQLIAQYEQELEGEA